MHPPDNFRSSHSCANINHDRAKATLLDWQENFVFSPAISIPSLLKLVQIYVRVQGLDNIPKEFDDWDEDEDTEQRPIINFKWETKGKPRFETHFNRSGFRFRARILSPQLTERQTGLQAAAIDTILIL